METAFPFLLAGAVGFSHAFEADHLVAVSSIVTRRNNLILAAKDGLFWGLGHTSTIFLIGGLMVLGRFAIGEVHFSAMEALVGLMLIALGAFRLYRFYRKPQDHDHSDGQRKSHQMAYGVGLIHGLAGSGAIVLLVMTEIKGGLNSMLYLLLFGFGSVLGMFLAAGLFSLPFTKRLSTHPSLQGVLILLSSLLCIGYGGYILYAQWPA